MPYNKLFESTLYNEAWLRRVYIDEDRNAAQVAKLAGCTNSAVLGWLRKFGIPVKNPSDAQKLAENHPGSTAPRPRGIFRETLYNHEWLLARVAQGLSLSKIGEEAGCSSGAVRKVLIRDGFEAQWREARHKMLADRRDARNPPRQREFSPRRKRSRTEGAIRARARKATPEGPCVLCGLRGTAVNHKDRNVHNSAQSNLERLCGTCHVRQHAMEHKVALEWLQRDGTAIIDLHHEARRRLLLPPTDVK